MISKRADMTHGDAAKRSLCLVTTSFRGPTLTFVVSPPDIPDNAA
jgi:hypothetical protein